MRLASPLSVTPVNALVLPLCRYPFCDMVCTEIMHGTGESGCYNTPYAGPCKGENKGLSDFLEISDASLIDCEVRTLLCILCIWSYTTYVFRNAAKCREIWV